MDIISTDTLNAIHNDANTRIIKFGRINKIDQPKVYEKDGRTIIKLFYPKRRRLSSDRIRPRALRFYKNVQRLREHGYAAPTVTKVQFHPDSKMYLLHYEKVPGQDIRRLGNQGELNVVTDLARFVADLHAKGIFFRSIHLENILYQPDKQFALIDVTDVRFKWRALSLPHRYRNLKHLFFSSPDDGAIWKAYGVEKFLDEYFKHAELPGYKKKMLAWMIRRCR
jgi:tRNA A-37 threonylcarbamoyl transferase component Bud32